MAGGFRFVFKSIDYICLKTGKTLSLLIFIIMFLTTIEAVARYVFNQPTAWAWPITRQLFAIFALAAGSYTMAKGGHIRVEIFYDRFPPKVKTVARYIALVCFLIFIVALVLQGGRMGLMSFKASEVATGAFAIPLYPVKLLIPVGAALLLLEGIVVFTRRNGDEF